MENLKIAADLKNEPAVARKASNNLFGPLAVPVDENLTFHECIGDM